jgi:hypothetical protein
MRYFIPGIIKLRIIEHLKFGLAGKEPDITVNFRRGKIVIVGRLVTRHKINYLKRILTRSVLGA